LGGHIQINLHAGLMAFPFQNFHLKDAVGPADTAKKRLHAARDAANRVRRVGAEGKFHHIQFAVPIGIQQRAALR